MWVGDASVAKLGIAVYTVGSRQRMSVCHHPRHHVSAFVAQTSYNVCQLIEVVCFGRIALQVFLSGKMVVFNKNCLEIATKTTLFKTFAAGLDAEFQIAMLSNLVCFFDV